MLPSDVAKIALWKAGLINWKLWPQQVKIYETIRGLPHHAQTAVVLCARQYGKSYLGTLMGVEDCLRNPGVSVLIVGPTLKQTTDIVNQSLKIIDRDSPDGLIRRSKSESRWYIGESELIIGGFDINNATRQRGKTLHTIYLEELVDSNPDDYLEAIRSDLGPALTHSKDGRMVYLTTPPRMPDHPFLTETIPESKLNGAFFCFTIDDNEQLSQEQYDACVRRCGGESTIEFRREYLCEIVRDPSIMVVPDFSVKAHVVNFPPSFTAYFQTTIDWGGVRDYTVALLHSYDFLSDTDLFIDERVFSSNTVTNQIVDEVLEMEKKYLIHQRTVDAPGQLLVDLGATHKFDCRLPPKEDWRAAVNTLAVRFSLRRALINPRCKFLIQSLQSGTFNKARTDFERTLTLGHCDAIAAAMYAVRTMDRSNPFSSGGVLGGEVGYEQQDSKSVAESLSSRSFSNTFGSDTFKHKKFGKFR